MNQPTLTLREYVVIKLTAAYIATGRHHYKDAVEHAIWAADHLIACLKGEQ